MRYTVSMSNKKDTPDKKCLYPKIADELNSMRDRDQKLRLEDNPDFKAIERIDKKHTKRLKEIIEKIGWPNKTKVGEQASKNAWLLAQHADLDLEFQEKCLELMMKELEGEVRKRDIAYLTDRIFVAKGLPQRYGTQFYKNEDTQKYSLQDVEDPENIEKRREEMGLESIRENVKSFCEIHKLNEADINLGSLKEYLKN